LLYEQAPDAVYQTKALYHLQGVARLQGDLAESERICLILQHWTRDKRPLPKEMLRKGYTFEWIQASARSMMCWYAELHNEFKAKRIARINDFVDNHVSVGRQSAESWRKDVLRYLDKLEDVIPDSAGWKADL
jgi:hypothetical protein